MGIFTRQVVGVVLALFFLNTGLPVYAGPEANDEMPPQNEYDREILGTNSETDQDDGSMPSFIKIPLVLGGMYAIGRQDNGEKVLGTVWMMGATLSHGTEPAQTGFFLLSLYNFTHLTGGDVSNEEVAEHNLIGFLLIGLSETLYNAYDKPDLESDKALSFGMYLDPQIQSPMLRFEYRF